MNRYKMTFEYKCADGKWRMGENWCYHDTAQKAYDHMCHLNNEDYDEWRDTGLYKLTDFGYERVGDYE